MNVDRSIINRFHNKQIISDNKISCAWRRKGGAGKEQKIEPMKETPSFLLGGQSVLRGNLWVYYYMHLYGLLNVSISLSIVAI